MEKVNWGIIGCGNVTEKKSGPAFSKIENSKLVAVMRRNLLLAEDYAKRHGVETWYNDADALINDPNVNAVYIATPPSSHKEYALRAIAAGKPVYIEKPMGLTYLDCKEVLDEGRVNKVPVYVAYYRRALPYFLKVRELLGFIGDVRMVSILQYRKPVEIDKDSINWRFKPEISGGGLFHDLGCHILDVIDMIVGNIVSAKGYTANQGQRYEADDTVSANFEFANGALGIGLWCYDSGTNLECNEIIGTKGKIKFSTFTFEPIELHTEKGIEVFKIDPPEHIQMPLIQTIVNELTGKGYALSTGDTAIRTAWVMDEICKRNK